MRRLGILLIAAALTGCLDSTGPEEFRHLNAEGTLTVTDGSLWAELELVALPTVLDCGTGLPVDDQEELRSGGTFAEDFTFSVSVSAHTDLDHGCFEIEVRRRDAETGPRVVVGPATFTEGEDGEPIRVDLEYDGTSLLIRLTS